MIRYEKQHADCIIKIAEGAARIMTDSRLGEGDTHENKGAGNFVTKYDVAVQEYLIGALSSAFPEALFLAEEKENGLLTDAPTFIIDPIDGTANFVFDLRHSAISIALCVKKTPVLGVVVDPYQQEIFYAVKGEGAYLRRAGRDVRLSVRDLPLCKTPVLVGTDPYHKATTAPITASLLKHILAKGMDIRRMGAAALDLAYVAAGRASLFAELYLSVWDYAAGLLLVTEAGGTVTTMKGTALPFTPSSVVAGAPTAHKEFFAEVLSHVLAECSVKDL
jgi:myo-inositol-1(or 4)-monophosphatase